MFDVPSIEQTIYFPRQSIQNFHAMVNHLLSTQDTVVAYKYNLKYPVLDKRLSVKPHRGQKAIPVALGKCPMSHRSQIRQVDMKPITRSPSKHQEPSRELPQPLAPIPIARNTTSKLTFHRFPQNVHSQNVVIGSSALLVWACE